MSVVPAGPGTGTPTDRRPPEPPGPAERFGSQIVVDCSGRRGDGGGPLLDAVATEILMRFNRCGLLGPAEIHTALRLASLAGETDPAVVLAAALAVRAPRAGHVSVDLGAVRSSVVVGEDPDIDLTALPWPDPDEWVLRLAASRLVGSGPSEEDRPVRLEGTTVYLDRLWRDELAVAADLVERARGSEPSDSGPGGDPGRRALERLFPGVGAEDQRRAAATALGGRLAVIAGGPGTGKTTTVARLLAVLFDRADGEAPLVGLTAPTGKAAARMEEAVRREADRLDVPAHVRRQLASLRGSTLHRLLGFRPDRPGMFRHHRGQRLPHDLVVVDEASMLSLALMARLVEALRPDARLVLVGDPGQLVSVEAGAVLADIVEAAAPGGDGALAGRISVLRRNHRFSGGLARLAECVRAGDADEAVAVLRSGTGGVRWVEQDISDTGPRPPGAGGGAGSPLDDELGAWAASIVAAARAGDAGAAIAALRRHRILCAHRHGPFGVGRWNRWAEQWAAGPTGEVWYPGRPVVVTANDYPMRLFNGDTGVAVAVDAGSDRPVLRVALDAAPVRLVGASRLHAVETVFAMTVHKSQGSEFDRVTFVLPPPGSRLLTRELLYTAVTRARQEVTVVGGEEALRLAVARRAARASGLGLRLRPC